MKSFKQFLMETPPPDSWDRDIFTKSFKKQIDYALERSTRLGQGSSRVAFEIEFEGRPTVLKIAKNAKGLAQNEKEADWGMFQMYPDILIPLIDVDGDNDPPRWLHFEKAGKLTNQIFQSMTGYSFEEFGNMIRDDEDRRRGKGIHNSRGGGWGTNWVAKIPQETQDEIIDSELFRDVCDLTANFDIMAADLTALHNWGTFEGRPVIIDIGVDIDTFNSNYLKKSDWKY